MFFSRRTTGPKATNVAAILFAACFLLCSILGFQVRTEEGTHCPTAPVQTIVKKSCDSCKPKPGDKDFVQCRCAEKKAAKTIATTSTKFELIVALSPSVDLPGRIATPRETIEQTNRAQTRTTAPDTLPPA